MFHVTYDDLWKSLTFCVIMNEVLIVTRNSVMHIFCILDSNIFLQLTMQDSYDLVCHLLCAILFFNLVNVFLFNGVLYTRKFTGFRCVSPMMNLDVWQIKILCDE